MPYTISPVTVSASSTYSGPALVDLGSGPFPASNAVDGNTSTAWVGNVPGSQEWIQFDYGEAQQPVKWRYRPHPENTSHSVVVELRASNDVAFGTYDVIETITTLPDSNWHEETLTVPTPYRYWRIHRTTTGSLFVVMEHQLQVEMEYVDVESENNNFHDVLLPQRYSYSTRKGMVSHVTNFEADSKDPYSWSLNRPIFSWDIFYGLRTHDQRGELRRFWYCRYSKLYSFRFRDNEDYTSKSNGVSSPGITDQPIVQVGSQYFLAKNYGVYTRRIKLPSEVVISYNGIDVTSVCTTNPLTGEVTGFTPGDLTLFKAGFEFDNPVRFTSRFPPNWRSLNGIDIPLSVIEVLEDLN